MFVLPHTTVSVVRMSIIAIDDSAGNLSPALAGTHEVPASGWVDLAADKDVTGDGTQGAKLAISRGGEIAFAGLGCRSNRLILWL